MEGLERSYEVIKRIKRLKETMHVHLQKLFKEMNLTGPQGMVVGILLKHEKMKVSEVSAIMDLSMSTVSGILDRLEKQGMIVREKSEADGRVILVSLTESFKESSHIPFKEIEESWTKKINRASEEEIDTILTALAILERLINEESEQ